VQDEFALALVVANHLCLVGDRCGRGFHRPRMVVLRLPL